MSAVNTPSPPGAPGSTIPAGQPFCSVCGYQLSGAVESAVCPECGTPLVECLVRANYSFRTGKPVRYTSPIKVFGLPLLQVALGSNPATGERKGHAKALIAIGDFATGGIACGGVCTGGVCVGGVCAGVCSLGGVSVGALTAVGGWAIGTGMSIGGLSAGALSAGGLSAGVGAIGGVAMGYYAYGGKAIGTHAVSRGAALSSDPAAAKFFGDFSWYFGVNPSPVGARLNAGWQAAGSIFAVDFVVAGAIALIAVWAKATKGPRTNPYAP